MSFSYSASTGRVGPVADARDGFSPPSASRAVSRFLGRVLGPGTFVSATLLFNAAAAPVIASMVQQRPTTLLGYMVEEYHQLFCLTHDPRTPIDKRIWTLEEPLLRLIALQAMRADAKLHPGLPATGTPILPAGPAPVGPPAPAQFPTLPCCEGGTLATTLVRRGRRNGAMKAGTADNASPAR